MVNGQQMKADSSIYYLLFTIDSLSLLISGNYLSIGASRRTSVTMTMMPKMSKSMP